jgi:hypothetical protein
VKRVSLALLLVLCCAGTAAAPAHTLSLSGAQRVAARKAQHLADRVPPPEHVTIQMRGCGRARTATGKAKPHTVDCKARFIFDKLGQACDSIIRVQFASDTSTHTRATYPKAPVCRST